MLLCAKNSGRISSSDNLSLSRSPMETHCPPAEEKWGNRCQPTIPTPNMEWTRPRGDERLWSIDAARKPSTPHGLARIASSSSMQTRRLGGRVRFLDHALCVASQSVTHGSIGHTLEYVTPTYKYQTLSSSKDRLVRVGGAIHICCLLFVRCKIEFVNMTEGRLPRGQGLSWTQWVLVGVIARVLGLPAEIGANSAPKVAAFFQGEWKHQ